MAKLKKSIKAKSKKVTAKKNGVKKAKNAKKTLTLAKQVKQPKKTKIIKTKEKKPAASSIKKMTMTQEITSNPIGVTPYVPAKGEEYMNPKQLKHFENILNDWKKQLMQRADITKHHIQDESSIYPDMVDRAYQEEEFSRELRTRDRERKLLKKIDEALERIKENMYGFCVDCGGEIGLRRLEARPTATQCIECKTISELKEKQVGEVEE
jgi:DnaK suppressor protein